MVLDTKSRQKQRAWTRLCGRQVADVPMLKIYVCVYIVFLYKHYEYIIISVCMQIKASFMYLQVHKKLYCKFE